jgi:hypothetical protein
MRRVLCTAATLTVIMTGCTEPRTPPAVSTLGALSDSLRALQLPPARAGEMTRDSTWRVYVGSDSASQLYLIHRVAALVLPDGPFTLEAPLTYLRYEAGAWQQETQKRGGVQLPKAVEQALVAECTDRERIYFYRVRVIELRAANGHSWMAQLRPDVQAVTRAVTAWRSKGFIGGDAEP